MSDNTMKATTRAMLAICAFGLSSFIVVAVVPEAMTTTYNNQDNLVQETKWRNAGYFDDENGIELNISQENFADGAKHANDFLAKNRESLNNQPSK